MTGADWRRVKEVLADALDQAPGARAAYLARACAGDAALRVEVEALLRADADAGGFLDPAAAGESGAPADPVLGRHLGPYVVDRQLGQGGMGAVYLARRADREFDQRVAVKMVRADVDPALLVRRFRHERQILASLDHPHIARLFDGGTTADGRPYFVMEYVDGVAIDRFADERRLATADRLRLCLHVVDAVHHAHERHVIHRDIKPGNVLVTAAGHPKLLDFGIAKLLDAEPDQTALTALARPLTPDYASPEQVEGGAVTPATDVYALGLLLYELLTGHRPYRLATHTPAEMARVVCEQDPDRPSEVVTRTETVTRADGTTASVTPALVSGQRDASPAGLRAALRGPLDDIVLKALRKEPQHRYASAAALGDDIRRYLDDQPVAARRGARRYRAGRFVARHRLGVAATLLIAATIGLTAAVVRRSDRSAAGAAAPEPAAAVTPPRPSAAILRFRNLSGQAADEWLATALAEMLTSELAGGGGVRVVPPEAVASADRDAAVTPGAPDAVERLQQLVAADYVVLGAFTAGPPPARALRLDVRVASTKGPGAVVTRTGAAGDLFALVADVGRELRTRLAIEEPAADVARQVRAAAPHGVAATQRYAEGLDRLRQLDAVGARTHFEQAAAAEPESPLIQMGLAAAWTALGYDARAEAAAKRAADHAGGLTRESRLTVEGRLYEAQKDWAKAVEVYRTLWGFFSDNAEYGLRLAGALTSAGRAAEALAIVEALRKLPGAQAADPRIDLAESQAASALGDFPHELEAARRAVARARDAGAPQLLARAQVAEGRSLYNQGQLAAAKAALDAARAAFDAAGDRAGLAGALNSLGTVTEDLGDTSGAERDYQASFAAAEGVGDRRGMSSALNNLGILLKDHGRLDDALRAHQRALALRREVGDRNWTAVSLNNIGVVFFEKDRLAEAADYYGQSLAVAREIGDKRGEVRALHNLAVVRREAGDMAAARAAYERAIPARAAINDRRGGVVARVELGMVLLEQGDLAAATRVQEEAADMARALPMAEGEAQTHYQLGEIALAAGDLAAARRHHERALELRRKLQQTRTVHESEVALAVLALVDGRPADAAPLLRDAMSASDDARAIQVQARLAAVRMHLAAGDLAQATRAAAEARTMSRGTQRISTITALDLADARLAIAAGRPADARQRLTALVATATAKGLVLTALEARLLLCEALRAAGDPTARAALVQLRDDAAATGAGLIRRQAELLLRS